MTRSLFLLIVGIYDALLALTMIFMAEPSLINYGAVSVDLTHIAVMQYLGTSTAALAVLCFLSRNAPNSVGLRNSLLVIGLTGSLGIIKGMYDIFVLHPPMSAFFIGDTALRLALALGVFYFYNKESKAAQAEASVLA